MGYKKELLHRTGSKPYRQVAWDLGAKDGSQPSILQMFRATHEKGNILANTDVSKKYAKIQEIIEKNPSISHVEVVEEVFKSKYQHVVGYGGGVKLKDIRGPNSSRVELQRQLNYAKKGNKALSNQVRTLEAKNQVLTDQVGDLEEKVETVNEMFLNYMKDIHSTSHDAQK